MPAKSTELQRSREYYLVFISIVFGIFITGWAKPIIDTYDGRSRADAWAEISGAINVAREELGQDALAGVDVEELSLALLHALPENIKVEQQVADAMQAADAVMSREGTGLSQPARERISENLADTLRNRVDRFFDPRQRSVGLPILYGSLTLLVIVSLWWWYGMFLRWFAPAQGFLMYLYDFWSLGSFAVAAGLWTSGEEVFPIVVLCAAVLIALRFGGAYGLTKTVPMARKALKWALVFLFGGILTLAVFSAGALFGAGNIDWGWLLEFITKVMMGCSILVTFFAVYWTEGFGWGRLFVPSTFELQDLLLDPLETGVRPAELSITAARNLRNRALGEFRRACGVLGLQRKSAYMHSVVHSVNDLHAQVSLAAYACDGRSEDAITRFHLMYFVHWLDDVFDQHSPFFFHWLDNRFHQRKALLEKLCSKPSLTKLFSEPSLTFGEVFKNLPSHHRLAIDLRDKTKKKDFFEKGVVRLVYGALLFKDQYGIDVRRKHKEFLKDMGVDDRYLEEEDYGPFVDLSVKTVTEIWFALESGPMDFSYSFLFSLLYGPALYYHNVDRELEVQEHSDRWGKLDERRTAEFIDNVGKDLLDRFDSDTRMAGRAAEVQAFTECFSIVLPTEVRKAYESVAGALAKKVINGGDKMRRRGGAK